jgi:hypothetical protein
MFKIVKNIKVVVAILFCRSYEVLYGGCIYSLW